MITRETARKIIVKRYLFTRPENPDDLEIQIRQATNRLLDVIGNGSCKDAIRFVRNRNRIANEMLAGSYGLLPMDKLQGMAH